MRGNGCAIARSVLGTAKHYFSDCITMEHPLYIPREASMRAGFANGQLVRDAEKRGPDAVAEALTHEDAQFYIFAGNALVGFGADAPLIGSTADAPLVFLHDQSHANIFLKDSSATLLLGTNDDVPILALQLHHEHPLPQGFATLDLRSVYATGALTGAELAHAGLGASLLNWHGSHGFCAKCGTKSDIAAGGFKRICSHCEAEHFPRLDPVAIMMVIDADRCLLGRSPRFPIGMLSCLAGFIEPGETIEQAVRREVLEESNIAVGDVTYHASQPWPMPHSLMIGCYGVALNTEIDFDREELESCNWYARAEVTQMLEQNHPDGLTLPPRGSIASLLILDWLENRA